MSRSVLTREVMIRDHPEVRSSEYHRSMSSKWEGELIVLLDTETHLEKVDFKSFLLELRLFGRRERRDATRRRPTDRPVREQL